MSSIRNNELKTFYSYILFKVNQLKILKKNIRQFQETIWQFYHAAGRSFAWRNVTDPYKILISEVMLQQTQTHRVVDKFEQWLAEFPTIESLASASLRDVLSVWSGLGYNRRGMYLHQCAQRVVNEFAGVIPHDPAILVTFPGIGKNTAASICAFAFNSPTVFIETNIRTVFIHFFFNDQESVHDNEIMPLIIESLDHDNPREWYYALMDYGVMLKKTIPNPSRKSKHHAKQSKFEGSDRQIRGMILRELTNHSFLNMDELINRLQKEDERCKKIVQQMCQDGLIRQKNNQLMIS
jgi:A/G-specific adenine glycosylase